MGINSGGEEDGEDCLMCSQQVTQELICKLCSSRIHFICAFGTEVKNPNWRSYFRKGNYLCPVCTVGKNNQLVLKTVSNNQRHINVSKNATEFVLPASFLDTANSAADALAVQVGETEPAGENVDVEGSVTDTTTEDTGDNVVVEVSVTNTTGDNMLDSPPRHPLVLGGDNFIKGMLGGMLGTTPPQPPTPPPQLPPVHDNVPRARSSPVHVNVPPARSSEVPQLDEAPHQPPEEATAPIHQSDVARSGRLSHILNTFKNLPAQRSTVIIGDSNNHLIDGKEVDPDGSVVVRSFSGLCIVSTVYALKRHKFSYRKIKKVVYSISLNDFLHSDQHCQADWPVHIKNLQTESLRVFPNAVICFVLPFPGLPSITNEQRKDLEGKLKLLCPKIKRYNPPSMRGKVSEGGVHINQAGKALYVRFLQKNFSRHQPVITTSGRGVGVATVVNSESFRLQQQDRPPLQQPHVESFRVRPPDFPSTHQVPAAVQLPIASSVSYNQLQPPRNVQQHPSAFSGLAGEIVDAFGKMMQTWRWEPPPHDNRYQGQWRPPQ